MTSTAQFTDCTFIEPSLLTLVQGVLDGCLFLTPLTNPGEALVVSPDLDDVLNSTFNQGALGGHALEVTATGSHGLVECTFVGYGPSRQAFNAQDVGSGGDVDDTNDEIDITTHGFTTGEEVYYSDEGGTQLSGLVDQTRYYARAVTANSVSLHATEFDAENNSNKLAITAGSDETHALYSANAAVLNSSGGAVTLNITGGTSPSIRNTAGSTTTVVQTTTLQVTVSNKNGDLLQDVNVRFEQSDGTLISQGATNGSGVFSFSQDTAPLPFNI